MNQYSILRQQSLPVQTFVFSGDKDTGHDGFTVSQMAEASREKEYFQCAGMFSGDCR